MTLRTFAILMLLLVSTLSGVGHVLNKNPLQGVAEASIPATTAPLADEVPKNITIRDMTSEPSVRVVLPSPYEIRTN